MKGRARSAVTLIELMLALVISTGVMLVLGGMSLAVYQAKEYSTGVSESAMQTSAAIDRIETLFTRTGSYRLPGQPSRYSVAITQPNAMFPLDVPDTLVLWTGGRDGDLSKIGTLDRLPKQNELIVITPNPSQPTELVEFTFPKATDEIDFNADDFLDTIRDLIRDGDAEKTVLCDRLRAVSWDWSSRDTAAVRFSVRETPSDVELNAADPGTAEWNRLRWAGGICSEKSGLRQLSLRMELLVQREKPESAKSDWPHKATAFFGSATRRFLYEPAEAP